MSADLIEEGTYIEGWLTARAGAGAGAGDGDGDGDGGGLQVKPAARKKES